MKNFLAEFCGVFILIIALSTAALSQTTAFTYQGSLKASNLPANGTYDFIFMLFDAPTGGNNLGGPSQYFTNRQVTDGIFSFSLDFGNLFTGIPVFLEVRVGPAGTPPGQLTVLSPRQQVTSAPYAIKSVTADDSLKLGGVTANQFVQTSDSRLTDARNPLPGSSNYIQNGTAFQSGSNFNISGNGTVGGTVSANFVNSNSGFNYQGARLIAANSASNLYIGLDAGNFNSILASGNTFVAESAGRDNTSGSDNSFFGVNTGRGNTTGSRNSYFGRLAGRFLTTGDQNTAIGYGAGDNNTVGSDNTFVGANADASGDNLSFATALGAGAVVQSSNTIQLGRTSGLDAVNISGKLRVGSLGTGGATPLCRNASNEIGSCSSSVRYKSNISPFISGLELIRRLRPVSFEWTAGGTKDFGLVAEEVANVEPLLTTTNEKGDVEGVKYDRVGVVLVNAVQEQQKLIDAQNEELKRLKAEIDALKQLVCAQNPTAAVCRVDQDK